MNSENRKRLSEYPIVVWLGIISSLIAIFAFITGYQSLSAITTQSEKTIIGLWERRSSENTEYFNLQSDGSYTIEARSNSTNDVTVSNNGTFTYDKNNIYYVDKDNNEVNESYYLDNGGDLLVINNKVELVWTRIR